MTVNLAIDCSRLPEACDAKQLKDTLRTAYPDEANPLHFDADATTVSLGNAGGCDLLTSSPCDPNAKCMALGDGGETACKCKDGYVDVSPNKPTMPGRKCEWKGDAVGLHKMRDDAGAVVQDDGGGNTDGKFEYRSQLSSSNRCFSDPWKCIPAAALRARRDTGNGSLSVDARCPCELGQVLNNETCMPDPTGSTGKPLSTAPGPSVMLSFRIQRNGRQIANPSVLRFEVACLSKHANRSGKQRFQNGFECDCGPGMASKLVPIR